MCPNFDAITNHIDGETANYMDIAQSHVSECRIHAEPAMNANESRFMRSDQVIHGLMTIQRHP
jgi:hypothetical protein